MYLKSDLSDQAILALRCFDIELALPWRAIIAISDEHQLVEAENRLSKQAKTVVFVDMVESVRLIEADEHDVVSRWIQLCEVTKSTILDDHGGRFVKSYGDGMLLSFGVPRDAVRAALAILASIRESNANLKHSQEKIRLRIGVSTADVIVGPDDIYGHGVNVANRLVSIAKPDEILISQETHEHLINHIDVEIVDKGECWVRNLEKPIRAFRVGPAGAHSELISQKIAIASKPTLAVMPLEPRIASPQDRIFGEVVAEELIRHLTRSASMNVISRLSSAALASNEFTVSEIGKALGANYVVSGTFDVRAGELRINPELSETSGDNAIWSDTITSDIIEVFQFNGQLISDLAGDISLAIVSNELEEVRHNPLPSLRAYTLLFSAVALMHRLSQRDFRFARELLEALIDRAPRNAMAQAWYAYWHSMLIHQGWSDNHKRDISLATDAVSRALDFDSGCAFALTVDGAVKANLQHRFDLAEKSYDAAMEKCPSEALAWILQAALYAFTDRGSAAVETAHQAIRLSPCDPQRYMFDAIAASAHLTAGQDSEALSFSDRSLKANRLHTSTWRVKAVAAWRLGLTEEARQAVAELMALEPGLSISGYKARSPNTGSRIGQQIVDAFKELGVPD